MRNQQLNFYQVYPGIEERVPRKSDDALFALRNFRKDDESVGITSIILDFLEKKSL